MAEGEVVIPVSLEPDLQKTQEAGEKLGRKLSNTLKKTTELDLDEKTKKTAMTAKNLLATFNQLNDKINSKLGAPVDQKAYDAAAESVNKYRAEIKKLDAVLEEAKRKNEALSNSINESAALHQKEEGDKIQKKIEKYAKLQSELEQKRDSLIKKFMGEHGLSDKNTAISALETQSTQYQNIIRNLEKYLKLSEQLEAKKEEIWSTDSSKFKTDAEEKRLKTSAENIEKIRQKLTETQSKLATSKQMTSDLLANPYQAGTKEYIADVQKLEDTVNKLSMAYTNLNSAVSANGALEGSTNVMARLGEVAGKAAQSISSLVTRLLRLAGASIKSGIKTLSKEVQNLGKSSDSSSISVNKAIKTFIKYTFGVRSFFYLFRKMRSAVIDSIKAMADMRLGNINESLNQLKLSLQYLKDSWAAAFAPIIEFVTPALTTLMDVISNLTNKIAAFIALLTGKQIYVKAVKQTSALADSTKAGADAQKEWNNELYSFDELNRQTDPDKNSGSGGGNTSAFEEVPITGELSDWLVDWIERLKEAWSNENFEEVGLILAEGLNQLIYAATDWIENTFRPWAVEWAGNIARILNGVVAGLDWEALGNLFAQGLNAIADAIDTFLTTFDFELFGHRLGYGIKSFFDNVEWDLIGKTFADKWNALIDFIYGLVTVPDIWKTMGQSISEFIISMFFNINWKKAADAISTGFNGIVKTIHMTITNIPWPAMAETLTDSFNKMINDIDWGEIGSTVSDFILQLGGTIVVALANIDWAGIGHAIGEFIANIDWISVIALTLSGLMAFAVGLFDALIGIIAGVFDGIGDNFSDIGNDAIGGFFKGIGDALKGFTDWIKTNMVDPLINGVKEFLGIHSPSTVFSEIGSDIVAGMLEGISDHWNNVVTFVTDGLTTIKENFTDVWNNISSLTNSVWSSIKSFVDETLNNIKTKVSDIFNAIKTTISTIWNDVKEATNKTWTDLKNFVIESWNNLKASIGSVSFVEIGEGLVNGILEGIENLWNSLKEGFLGKINSLVEGAKDLLDINSPSKVFAKIGENIVLGLEEGISDNADDAIKVTATLASDIGNVNFELENLPNSVDAIIDRLLKIQDAFVNISDSILQLGNIPIPAIAFGGVVPSMQSSNATEMYDNITSAIKSALTDDNNGNSIFNQESPVFKVYLRGKEIFDAVVDENNSAIMRTGESPLVR